MSNRLMRQILCAAAIAGFACVSTPARAQTWLPPDPTDKPWVGARVNIGPIYFNPTFDLKNVGLDSNVFDDPTFARQDLTGTLSMRSLMGVHFGERLIMRFVQDTSYVWYRRYRSERSVDGGLGGVLELRTSAFRPWFSFDQAHTHARQGYEIDARAGRTIPTIEAGADVNFGLRLGASVAYHREKTTYASGEQQFSGLTNDQVDLGVALDNTTRQWRSLGRWKMTDLADLVGGAEYIKDRFANNPLNDSDSKYYFGGVETRGDALIVGNLYVGYKKQTHLDPTVPSFKGVSASSNVSFVPQERTKIELGVDRDPHYSYESQYAYYVQEGGSLTLTERVANQLDATVSAKGEWLKYQTIVASSDPTRIDRDLVFGVGMGYFVGGQNGSRYGVTVERAERHSPIASRNYRTMRVYTNVKFSF